MRNVFLTYHHADQTEVDEFIKRHSGAFNDLRAIGIGDSDPFVDSADTDYVLRQIREKYLRGTSATIALVGTCTWARRYVDWETAATLRDNPLDPRGGLLAVQLPRISGRSDVSLPPRIEMNREYDSAARIERGYASYHAYPSTPAVLAAWVESAIERRNRLEPVPGSTQALQKINKPC